ncbi:Secondary metabolism regulator, partial [Lachnellula suecica]
RLHDCPPLPNNSAISADLPDEDAEQDAPIDTDSGTVANDAGYETDDAGTESTSLASSVEDYTFENGRRYHKFHEGCYHFPNDDLKQEREDMAHSIILYLCGQLHFAPIGMNPQIILDMGTGTGIWAMIMGEKYPSANILGVDLSPIQPEWVPSNVRFMIDDVESPWVYLRNHFDYIHSRHMVVAVREWPRLMRRALRHLKPGGWIEMQEIHHHPHCHDGSMPPDHPVAQYWSLIRDGLACLGVDSDSTLLLADMMRNAGFDNVTIQIFHVPIGTWPKDIMLKTVGGYWRTILLDGAQPIALGPLTRGLKWSREQVEVRLVEVRKAYINDWVHSYMPLYIICGQKPGGMGK